MSFLIPRSDAHDTSSTRGRGGRIPSSRSCTRPARCRMSPGRRCESTSRITAERICSTGFSMRSSRNTRMILATGSRHERQLPTRRRSALSLAGRWTPARSSREDEGGRLPSGLNGADRSNGPSSVRGVGEAPCFSIVHRRDQVVDVLLHRLGDVWLCRVQAGEEGHRILEVADSVGARESEGCALQ